MWRLATFALIGCGRLAFDTERAPHGAFSDVCRFPKLAVVRDGAPGDDAAGATLPQPILDACGTDATVRSVSQGDPGILDPATDRPLLSPDELGLLGGGTAPQRALHYLDIADTPLLVTDATSALVITTRDNRTILDVPKSSLGPSHDIATLMYVCAADGACVVSVFGETLSGTQAAAYYFTTVLAPELPTDRTWYVVDWADRDGDLVPSPKDALTVVGSG